MTLPLIGIDPGGHSGGLCCLIPGTQTLVLTKRGNKIIGKYDIKKLYS